jgi:hypothetical protein
MSAVINDSCSGSGLDIAHRHRETRASLARRESRWQQGQRQARPGWRPIGRPTATLEMIHQVIQLRDHRVEALEGLEQRRTVVAQIGISPGESRDALPAEILVGGQGPPRRRGGVARLSP